MAKVTVHMIDRNHLSDFYFTSEPVAKAKEYLESGLYTAMGPVDRPFQGEEAAEDMFDMSNNPYRQTVRNEYFGRMRSLSVGDIVEVDGTKYLCRPAEWVVV